MLAPPTGAPLARGATTLKPPQRMSILGEYAASISLSIIAIAVPALAASRFGVFRAPPHPRRIPSGQTAWYLVLVLGISIICFLSVQVLYFAVKQALTGNFTTPQALEKSLTVKDWAFLATVPQICAFLVLLIGDWAVGGPPL